MFLEATMRRNPQLVDAAVELHRNELISPNTFLIDIDRVIANAGIIQARAAELGVGLHMMTKQQGRNPFLALAARHAGISTAVAVDMSEARILHRHGIPLGHVGHLVQVPARETAEALAMQPQAITVFSMAAAQRISQAAAGTGQVQDILLRVWKPGDFVHPGQEGGFRLGEVEAAAKRISDLPGIRIAGVTSFPCLLWDEDSQAVRPTGNLASATEAADLLRSNLGIDVTQVNTPGVTSATTLQLIADAGATHGEPGSALTASCAPWARPLAPAARTSPKATRAGLGVWRGVLSTRTTSGVRTVAAGFMGSMGLLLGSGFSSPCRPCRQGSCVTFFTDVASRADRRA